MELINELLEKGKIEEVNKILDKNYTIAGVVSKGSQIGRKYDMKTANIELLDEHEHLKNGVYGVLVTIDGFKYLGIANIGNNPSFNYVEKKRLEVNIFDFSSDLYEKEINVELVIFVRNEKKFKTVEDLYLQINKDILLVKEKMENLL